MQKNKFALNHEDMIKLNELLKLKDPITHKITEQALENASSNSKDAFASNSLMSGKESGVSYGGGKETSSGGKETSRSKSSRFEK